MERITGSFLIYDDVIRIEYECEMVAEHDVWELRNVNDVRVFVGELRAYKINTSVDDALIRKTLWGLACLFYEVGCEPESQIDIHEAIERDAIERLKDREPEFDIPEGRDYE